MESKPPFEKLKEFYCNLPDKFALLPPIILDDISTFWQVRGGNDLLTPYILFTRVKFTLDFVVSIKELQ